MSYREERREYGVRFPNGEVVDGFDSPQEALEYADAIEFESGEIGVPVWQDYITELTEWEVL